MNVYTLTYAHTFKRSRWPNKLRRYDNLTTIHTHTRSQWLNIYSDLIIIHTYAHIHIYASTYTFHTQAHCKVRESNERAYAFEILTEASKLSLGTKSHARTHRADGQMVTATQN